MVKEYELENNQFNNIYEKIDGLELLLQDHICLDNSTNTLLGADEVFNGTYQDTLNNAEIIVSISTDQDSATDGLVICWSADGITCNETDEFTILANKGKTFTFPCNRRYFKLSYTNGSTEQTIFNNNRNSANTNTITIHKGTSGGTTDGTGMLLYKGGSATGSSSSVPTGSRNDQEIILKQNTKYILRATSFTNDNLINVGFYWYEHTNIAI